MKLILKKEHLQLAVQVLSKLSTKPQSVVLQAKEGFLHAFSSTDTYVRYKIPAEIEEPGSLGLQYTVFSDLLRLRKKEITMEHKKGSNTLRVDGGSKIEVYTLDITEDQYNEPEQDWDSVVKLRAKDVQLLRSLIGDVNFTYFNPPEEGQARLVNSSKGFCVQFADSPHCAFYETKEPICKEKFSFQAYVAPIKAILNFMDERVVIKISNSMLLFESEHLTATVLAVQDNQTDFIDQGLTFMGNDNYAKGRLVFNLKEFIDVLHSISIVQADGHDTVDMIVKGTKVILKMKTNTGVSNDSFSLKSNDYGNFKQNLSLPLTENLLYCCSSLSEEAVLSLSKNENFFRLEAVSESAETKVSCLAPFTGA